jgi:hypothetical protein
MFTEANLTVTRTVDIIGLGSSWKLYRNEGNTSIGVNDTWKNVQSDYMVIVDQPELWPEKDRYAAIIAARPKAFFSNREGWKGLIHNYVPIELHNNWYDYGNRKKILNSVNSTFVATVLAHRMGAREIRLWGVDFVGHPSLGGLTKDKAISDFVRLKQVLRSHNCALVFPPGPSLLHGL